MKPTILLILPVSAITYDPIEIQCQRATSDLNVVNKKRFCSSHEERGKYVYIVICAILFPYVKMLF